MSGLEVPIVMGIAGSLINGMSNKSSNANVQNAQQQRQGITAAAANQYRQQAGQLQQGINNQSRTAELGAQHAMSPMYGPPPGPGPMPMAGNMGPAPGQVAPGLAPPSPGQGPPPQMASPMHIMSAVQRQQGPNAYQQMTAGAPPPSPDTLNRLTILNAIGAGPRPGNIGPTPGPNPGSPPMNPSGIMGGRS